MKKVIYNDNKTGAFFKKGYTMIEILIVITIIGVLATVIIVALGGARDKARDAKRKQEISQMGRILSAGSCYLPDGGAGDYDLADLFDEIKIKYPQIGQYLSEAPRDPKTGNDMQSFYHYIVDNNGKCALYANLENPNDAVTLSSISDPTPGEGTGIFQAAAPGWNGSTKYYQVSN